MKESERVIKKDGTDEEIDVLFKGVVEMKVKEMVDQETKKTEIDYKDIEKVNYDKIIKEGTDQAKVKEATEWVNNQHKGLAEDQKERNRLVRNITAGQKNIKDLLDVVKALKMEYKEHVNMDAPGNSAINKQILTEKEKWTKACAQLEDSGLAVKEYKRVGDDLIKRLTELVKK